MWLFVNGIGNSYRLCINRFSTKWHTKELQGWLGVANYQRNYIPTYAQIVQPLYDIMELKKVPKSLRKKNGAPDGKKVIVTWTEEADQQFNKLKEIICSELVLSLPDFEREMIITTDASEIGYGAVLEQNFKNEDGTEARRPIEYYSKN